MAAYDFSGKAADAYFAPENHPMGKAWKACDAKSRDAYLAQAKRDYCAFTKVDVDTISANASPVPPRLDWAVFERALYIMLNSGATSDGNVSGPKWFGVPVDSATATKKGNPARPWERSEGEQRWWPIEVQVSLEGF